ncbi:hypothetical protein [Klebsiella aerogenes]|uniref:hypothetical protein n=1 Tax=Klebsiella aerogenes TaxID=548 RepID=UPI001D0D1AAB|nr:hypothetical protein [Klebsiella aerogenes]
MTPLWKPMPYFVLRDCGGLNKIKKNKVSTGVAALKIFIFICLKSNVSDDGTYCALITYDQFSQYCSLSRKLISEGLRYLENIKLIEVDGERKKRYILCNCIREDKKRMLSRFQSSYGHWCKLPYKGLFDEKGRITAFESMSNRNVVELNALKIFVYILMVRTGGKAYSAVTLKTIKARLSLSYQEIMVAIAYLHSIGLLERSDVGSNSISNYDERFSVKFLVCGWEGLEWKPHYYSDSDNGVDTWKEKLLDGVF